MAEDVLQRQIRILTNKVSDLLKETQKSKQEKVTWVKASDIMALTGWDKEKFRRMRNNGAVVQKRENGKIFYSLESLSPFYYKQK